MSQRKVNGNNNAVVDCLILLEVMFFVVLFLSVSIDVQMHTCLEYALICWQSYTQMGQVFI